jgi:MoaA/NifB/PqqE/SkfB family radical SAM enzyme
MDWGTFLDTMKFLRDDQYYTFGGGEPLMHPRIKQMIELILGMDNQASIWFATNGLATKKVWDMIDFASEMNEIYSSWAVSIDLSIDYWHKRQKTEIREFFTKRNQISSSPFKTRDVSQVPQIMNIGRAKRKGLGMVDECCGGFMIKPWGDIRACSCPDAPLLGHVRDGHLHYNGKINPKHFKRSWTEPTDDWEQALDWSGCYKNALMPEKGHRNL